MVQHPRTRLVVQRAEHDEIVAPQDVVAKLQGVLQRLRSAWHFALDSGECTSTNRERAPGFKVTVRELPPRHSGFGSGTQMSLGLAVAVQKLWWGGPCKPEELALLLGRGQKSGVGTFGFFSGGFLVDQGLGGGDSLARLSWRSDFPAWPLVLVTFSRWSGLNGIGELAAFDKIAHTPAEDRAAMLAWIAERILPAIQATDWSSFSEAVYDFGRRSGDYYRLIQGGTFHNPEVAGVVAQIRQWGIPGVVQSSWGPTLAAICPDSPSADDLVQRLNSSFPDLLQASVTPADNRGADWHSVANVPSP